MPATLWSLTRTASTETQQKTEPRRLAPSSWQAIKHPSRMDSFFPQATLNQGNDSRYQRLQVHQSNRLGIQESGTGGQRMLLPRLTAWVTSIPKSYSNTTNLHLLLISSTFIRLPSCSLYNLSNTDLRLK